MGILAHVILEIFVIVKVELTFQHATATLDSHVIVTLEHLGPLVTAMHELANVMAGLLPLLVFAIQLVAVIAMGGLSLLACVMLEQTIALAKEEHLLQIAPA